LYFLPLPHGQDSLRPIFMMPTLTVKNILRYRMVRHRQEQLTVCNVSRRSGNPKARGSGKSIATTTRLRSK
jgi:hypothetical protein